MDYLYWLSNTPPPLLATPVPSTILIRGAKVKKNYTYWSNIVYIPPVFGVLYCAYFPSLCVSLFVDL